LIGSASLATPGVSHDARAATSSSGSIPTCGGTWSRTGIVFAAGLSRHGATSAREQEWGEGEVPRHAELMDSIHEALPIEAQLAKFTVCSAIATSSVFRSQKRTRAPPIMSIFSRGKWCSRHYAGGLCRNHILALSLYLASADSSQQTVVLRAVF